MYFISCSWFINYMFINRLSLGGLHYVLSSIVSVPISDQNWISMFSFHLNSPFNVLHLTHSRVVSFLILCCTTLTSSMKLLGRTDRISRRQFELMNLPSPTLSYCACVWNWGVSRLGCLPTEFWLSRSLFSRLIEKKTPFDMIRLSNISSLPVHLLNLSFFCAFVEQDMSVRFRFNSIIKIFSLWFRSGWVL